MDTDGMDHGDVELLPHVYWGAGQEAEHPEAKTPGGGAVPRAEQKMQQERVQLEQDMARERLAMENEMAAWRVEMEHLREAHDEERAQQATRNVSP